MQKEILEKIVDNQSNGVIILNRDLVVLYANKKVKDFFLSSVNQLLGDYLRCNYTIEENVHCQNTSNCHRCILNNTIKKVNEKEEEKILENIKYNSNGKYINLSLKISYVNEYIVIEFMDLCDLYEEINFLTRIMDKSKDIIFFKDSELRYKYVNKSCAELFNKDKYEILNKNDKELLKEEFLDETLYEKLKIGDVNTLRKGSFSEIINYKECYLRIFKEYIDNGILCTAMDITDEVIANRRAETDYLTNLYNRRKFICDISNILENKKEGYYLAIIDLDNLRDLNNNYGHIKGDKYLAKLGEVLNKHKKGNFYRIGGDEFAGLIKIEKNNVKNLFSSIFNDLRNLNYEQPLSLSAGIKEIDTNKSYEEIYNEVDMILYNIKENGKNNFIIS